MNKDLLKIWQWLGFAVTACGGTVLHFLFEWLDGAVWIAPFSGVNESTWEHMKLLFWPMFLFAVFEWLFFREEKAFWCIKLRGIVLGLALIPVLYYTYNGVVGKSPDWINIAIFFVSAAIAYLWETKQFTKENIPCPAPKRAIAILLGIAVLFILFTFVTPQIGIFKDPITGTYGI